MQTFSKSQGSVFSNANHPVCFDENEKSESVPSKLTKYRKLRQAVRRHKSSTNQDSRPERKPPYIADPREPLSFSPPLTPRSVSPQSLCASVCLSQRSSGHYSPRDYRSPRSNSPLSMRSSRHTSPRASSPISPCLTGHQYPRASSPQSPISSRHAASRTSSPQALLAACQQAPRSSSPLSSHAPQHSSARNSSMQSHGSSSSNYHTPRSSLLKSPRASARSSAAALNGTPSKACLNQTSTTASDDNKSKSESKEDFSAPSSYKDFSPAADTTQSPSGASSFQRSQSARAISICDDISASNDVLPSPFNRNANCSRSLDNHKFQKSAQSSVVKRLQNRNAASEENRSKSRFVPVMHSQPRIDKECATSKILESGDGNANENDQSEAQETSKIHSTAEMRVLEATGLNDACTPTTSTDPRVDDFAVSTITTAAISPSIQESQETGKKLAASL